MKHLMCVLLLAAIAATAATPDATGKWSGTFVPEGGDQSTAYMILKQAGTAITGTAGPDADTQWAIQSGKIAGNKVTIQVTDPDGGVYTCSLVLEGNSLKGDVELKAQGEVKKGRVDVSRIP